MELSVRIERWPLAGAFTISRGSKTEAVVVVAELQAMGITAAAAKPFPMHVTAKFRSVCADDRSDASGGRARSRSRRAADGAAGGAARNALDCAYWDLTAKIGPPRARIGRSGAPGARQHRLYDLARRAASHGGAAERAAGRPLLKVKLGGDDDAKRIAAVRRAAPRAELIVDANEGWSEDNLAANLAACADAGVTLIEQPLPEGADAALEA